MLRRLAGHRPACILFAVIGRFVEAMGAVRCGCVIDCWCHRPVLSTFRWVFPFRSPSRHRRLIRHSRSPNGSGSASWCCI